MGLFPPPPVLQALKNTKLVGMTETQNSLKDISTKGAHYRVIHVIYNFSGSQGGPSRGHSQWQVMHVIGNLQFD